MARKLRETFLEKHNYHIVNRGNNKKKIFIDEEDKSFFYNKFFYYLTETKNNSIIFCIMDNHFHTIIVPGGKVSPSDFLQRLCTSYSLYFNKKYRKVGHVFQGRFKSKLIETEQGLRNVINYIKENPVKAGYCDKPENYKWLWVAGLDGAWPQSIPHPTVTTPPV